ncbi:MAG TPA: CoA-binding protein, partial [Sphingomicrobium sp.]|nr:CoA-binding protein [Sphingomicrobium sp.]
MPLTRDEDIAELLSTSRNIALVGASDRPDRPSYGVMRYLQSRGYRVFPVNPQITGEHVHGEFVWRELAQIGEPIDIVEVQESRIQKRLETRYLDRRASSIDEALDIIGSATE